MIKKIFSIKNENSHKVLTLLGIKLKFKSETLTEQSFLTSPNENNLLIYSYANKKYYDFAILYPIWALQNNKNTCIEIALENLEDFKKKYNHLINYYYEKYPQKVFFTQINKRYEKIPAGTVRFISKPINKAKYLYIGDIDVIVLDDICSLHIPNIEKYNLDYSNIKRKKLNKLSGLHFIEYDKMYPICLKNINVQNDIDENILFQLMKNKGYKIPDENICTFRPIAGIHISYFSRPPLRTLTTQDNEVSFPSWYDNFNGQKITISTINKYLTCRNSEILLNFYSNIKENDVDLRRIIQIIDMFIFYLNQNKHLLTPQSRTVVESNTSQ